MEVKSRAFAEREKAIVDESLYGPPACKLFLPCVRYGRGVPDKLPLTIPLTTSLLLFARRWWGTTVSSPCLVDCGWSKCREMGFPNTARISPARQGVVTQLCHFCTNQSRSKKLLCLVQAKGGAVFGNPTVFGTPLPYLTSFTVTVLSLAIHTLLYFLWARMSVW